MFWNKKKEEVKEVAVPEPPKVKQIRRIIREIVATNDYHGASFTYRSVNDFGLFWHLGDNGLIGIKQRKQRDTDSYWETIAVLKGLSMTSITWETITFDE